MLHRFTTSSSPESWPVTGLARPVASRDNRKTGDLRLCLHNDCGTKCDQGFKRKRNTRANKNRRVCPYEGCGYAPARPRELIKHERCHTGEKPFVCVYEGCGYASTQSSNLIQHQRIHTGIKPFACPHNDCGYSSASSSYLKCHVRAVHDKEKPFACSHEGCGYRSTVVGNLRGHRRCHSGKRLFGCPHEGCGHAYTHPGGLHYHLRAIHIKEKPFVCPHESCGYAFILSSRLTYHLRIAHSGEQPFACPHEHCAKRFKQLSNVRRHLKTHAGQQPPRCCPGSSNKRHENQRNLIFWLRSHHQEPACSHAGKHQSTDFRGPEALQKDGPVHGATKPRACHQPECNSRFLRSQARNLRLRTASPGTDPDDSTAPSRGIRTLCRHAFRSQRQHRAVTQNSRRQPALLPVIVWVSGGIVYKSPPPAKNNAGGPNL